MSDDWTDRLAGARMQVDQQFQDKLDASEFTNQEWGLIMTAVEFEMENPEDAERARLVANTDKLTEIIPELENIQREMGGSRRPVESAPSGEGMFGRLKQYIHHLRSDSPDQSDDERLAAAKVLVDEYASDLQSYLEKRGQWEEIREVAAES
jgi:hypothetical protein